jgi:hypothetical protein
MEFLLGDHPYIKSTSTFIGKLARTWRHDIMSLVEWIRAYDTEKEKENIELFDANGEPMFDYPQLFDSYAKKIPIGMKMKYIFYELP